jgi:hypothetical protein
MAGSNGPRRQVSDRWRFYFGDKFSVKKCLVTSGHARWSRRRRLDHLDPSAPMHSRSWEGPPVRSLPPRFPEFRRDASRRRPVGGGVVLHRDQGSVRFRRSLGGMIPAARNVTRRIHEDRSSPSRSAAACNASRCSRETRTRRLAVLLGLLLRCDTDDFPRIAAPTLLSFQQIALLLKRWSRDQLWNKCHTMCLQPILHHPKPV